MLLELRAALSLRRLMRAGGRTDDARACVAALVDRLTGVGADLDEARAFLSAVSL